MSVTHPETVHQPAEEAPPKLAEELEKMPYEPLLPIEKKLILWSILLGVFLLGTWNRRANETGALIGFAAGIATMIGVTLLTRLAFTWYVLVGTVATFAIGSLASLAGGGPTPTGNTRHAAVKAIF